MNIGELAKFRGGIATDTISEVTSASGVTIDSVLCKDGEVTASGTNGVVTNTITERTSGSGVTIDGVLLKDNGITASSGLTIGNETLSKYDEALTQTFTITFTGGSTATATGHFCRVGRVVTCIFKGLNTTSATATGSFTGSAVPSGFRPLEQVVLPIAAYDNGVAQDAVGRIIIATNGTMTATKLLSGGSFSGGTSGATGMDSIAYGWISEA